jgi:CrcB protein
MIGVGGFIGSIGRYGLAQFIQNRFLAVFPYGTLTVNIIGCFMIGLLYALSERTTLTPEWRLFLATGVCGGFTTFSAFSLETINLLRDGELFLSALYIVFSIGAGLLATYMGFVLFK